MKLRIRSIDGLWIKDIIENRNVAMGLTSLKKDWMKETKEETRIRRIKEANE